MVRITTRDAHGHERVFMLSGELLDVARDLNATKGSAAYFGRPWGGGFTVPVEEIVRLDPVAVPRGRVLTKADWLGPGTS